MEIIRVTAKEYGGYFQSPYHVFNTVAFSELNRGKCDDLHYLVCKDKKARIGIILGKRGEMLCSPFSAPFGGFSFNRNEKLDYFEEAAALVKSYAEALDSKLKISLPPVIYHPTLVSKMCSSFIRSGYQTAYMDLNYQFEVERFRNYEKLIDTKTKNKLHNSQKVDFCFIQLDSQREEDVVRAYEVIRKNREARGFPLRMTRQAVWETVQVVKADFFVLSFEGVDVAAAQVFHVSSGIAQVIYWGDLPEYAELRVMNFFTYKVFEHYFSKGLRILDIGPSTENGVPNYGLCEFKENIGCTVSMKYTFITE